MEKLFLIFSFDSGVFLEMELEGAAVLESRAVSLCSGMDVRAAMLSLLQRYSAELAWLSDVSRWPAVVSVAPHVRTAAVEVWRYRTPALQCHVLLPVLRITLPCQRAYLLWSPWPPHVKRPQRCPGEYHHMQLFGKPLVMPRRTKNYGIAYTFSGMTHDLEQTTPPEIAALMSETNAMYRDAHTNMCLENDYSNGREAIGEHSDDEKQFVTKNVYCWVTGPASRVGIFRVKKSGSAVPRESVPFCGDPDNPMKTRELLRIELPEGLYVMCGSTFQETYSHEFPDIHNSLFKRLIEFAPKHFMDFPSDVPLTKEGAPQSGVVWAAWLSDRAEDIKAAIRAGKLSKKKDQIAQDLQNFDQWCLWRTSYTLRSFHEEK